MSGNSQSNLLLVRGLIEQAPDAVLQELESALAGGMGGAALGQVRDWIEREAEDRAVRDAVLSPLRPMFDPRPDGIEQLTFPRAALAPLWRALKAAAPVEAAAAAAPFDDPDGAVSPAFNPLCLIAADGLRQRIGGFAAVADTLDAHQPAGADLLARCLELAPIARQAIGHLPDWLHRMTDERAAVVRLTFKDAVAVCDDGGQRLFDILFANLRDPWAILRLTAAVIVGSVGNYAAGSELAVFGERLLDDLERRMALIGTFDLDGGAPAGMVLGVHVRTIGAGIDAFEHSLSLGKEGPWGARIAGFKIALAKAVEDHLRKADSIVAAALPQADIRIGGRVVRQGAKLDVPPDPRRIAQAQAVLTFVGQVRRSAHNGGYNTLRLKVVEDVELRLNACVESLLEAIHHGKGEEVLVARLYLDEAADLMGRIRDDKAAQIIRRRAAAA